MQLFLTGFSLLLGNYLSHSVCTEYVLLNNAPHSHNMHGFILDSRKYFWLKCEWSCFPFKFQHRSYPLFFYSLQFLALPNHVYHFMVIKSCLFFYMECLWIVFIHQGFTDSTSQSDLLVLWPLPHPTECGLHTPSLIFFLML